MTKFVLFTTQRSGSTWVLDTLNQSYNVYGYGEQLLREKRIWDVGPDDYPRYFEIDHSTLPGLSSRPVSLFAYLNGLYQRNGIVGFKLMYSTLRQYPEVWPYLHLYGIKVIHLVRENYLDILISKKLVLAKGQAHLLAEDILPERPATIFLEPTTLLADLHWLQQKTNAMHRLLRFSLLSYYTVTYETLAQNPLNFGTIKDFLGIARDGDVDGDGDLDAGRTQSSLRKIRQTTYAETIENFAEVYPLLANSEFAHLLEGGDIGSETDG